MAGALSATDGAPKPLMPMVYACLGISMCAAIFYEEYNVAVFALTIFCLETQVRSSFITTLHLLA